MSVQPIEATPLFPIPGSPITRTNRITGDQEVGLLPAAVHTGASMLDAFALTAPECPEWFPRDEDEENDPLLKSAASRGRADIYWPWWWAQQVLAERPKPTAVERAINGKEQS